MPGEGVSKDMWYRRTKTDLISWERDCSLDRMYIFVSGRRARGYSSLPMATWWGGGWSWGSGVATHHDSGWNTEIKRASQERAPEMENDWLLTSSLSSCRKCHIYRLIGHLSRVKEYRIPPVCLCSKQNKRMMLATCKQTVTDSWKLITTQMNKQQWYYSLGGRNWWEAAVSYYSIYIYYQKWSRKILVTSAYSRPTVPKRGKWICSLAVPTMVSCYDP